VSSGLLAAKGLTRVDGKALMIEEVFDRAAAGDRRMLARAISLIEDRAPGVLPAIGRLRPRRSQAPGALAVVGITGPPGSGKSTLVDHLIVHARRQELKVAVVAVDPSSPFTGGAILGDRIRMDQHILDPGVFVRSLSSRGHLGGLCRAAGQVVDLLDAAGFDLVIVETVGVGQSELAIIEVADTAVVVLTPESGDTVQTMKAGLLEIADVFVVNKADRDGALRMARNLEEAVSLDLDEGWKPPVLMTSALSGQGVDAVLTQVQAHLAWSTGAGLATWKARRGRGRVRTFLDLIADEARCQAARALEQEAAPLRQALEDGLENPYVAANTWKNT
jgi:LAO/AO transport system kinase